MLPVFLSPVWLRERWDFGEGTLNATSKSVFTLILNNSSTSQSQSYYKQDYYECICMLSFIDHYWSSLCVKNYDIGKMPIRGTWRSSTSSEWLGWAVDTLTVNTGNIITYWYKSLQGNKDGICINKFTQCITHFTVRFKQVLYW